MLLLLLLLWIAIICDVSSVCTRMRRQLRPIRYLFCALEESPMETCDKFMRNRFALMFFGSATS